MRLSSTIVRADLSIARRIRDGLRFMAPVSVPLGDAA